MGAYFSPAALRFFRALARHNDREWFRPRKPTFLREIHEPMVRLCDDVNAALARIAPAHVQPTQKAMMRIYENMRFHSDRPPLKRQLGVWWGRRGVQRTSGAGFYLHLSAQGLEVAAGVFRPSPQQLRALRAAIAREPDRLRTLLRRPALARLLPECSCAAQARARGGAPSSCLGRAGGACPICGSESAGPPAKCVRWGRSVALDPEVATGDGLLREVVRRFRAAAPAVAYLDAATLL